MTEMPNSEIKDAFAYQERRCFRCNKEFMCHDADSWAYKAKGHLYCSWHCLQESREEKPGSKRERKMRICQAIRDGLTQREIVALFNEDVRVVSYWWTKLKGGASDE